MGAEGLTQARETATVGAEFFPARWIMALAVIPGRVFFMRAIVLIDGQNLYHMARRSRASGPQSPYGWPSYDVEKLASALVASTLGRTLEEIRFYTGVPEAAAGPSRVVSSAFS